MTCLVIIGMIATALKNMFGGFGIGGFSFPTITIGI